MDRSKSVLRFKIDGSWTAEEMAAFVTCIDDLYNVSLVQRIAWEDQPNWESRVYRHYAPWLPELGFPLPSRPVPPPSYLVSRLTRLVAPDEKLRIEKLAYASPGNIDFAGFGQVVGHVKDFAQFIIEKLFPSEDTKLADDEQRLKNDSIRIQNAREYVKLYRELGYSETEVRELVSAVDDRQEILIRHVHEHRITGVMLIGEQQDGGNEGGGGGGGGSGGGGGGKRPSRKIRLS